MPTNTFLNLSEEKQKKIIDAANKEFERVPIEQVSIKNIVETAEIARGSFYQYFEDKDDLFEYVINLKMGDMEKNMKKIIEKEDGNIINVFTSLYDHLIKMGRIKKNNKFFRQIFGNIRASDNFMLIRKETMNEKLNQNLYELYEKNKEILNVKNEQEYKLIIEILSAVTRRRVVASLKYKDLAEARKDYLKEIDFIKNGVLKKE